MNEFRPAGSPLLMTPLPWLAHTEDQRRESDLDAELRHTKARLAETQAELRLLSSFVAQHIARS